MTNCIEEHRLTHDNIRVKIGAVQIQVNQLDAVYEKMNEEVERVKNIGNDRQVLFNEFKNKMNREMQNFRNDVFEEARRMIRVEVKAQVRELENVIRDQQNQIAILTAQLAENVNVANNEQEGMQDMSQRMQRLERHFQELEDYQNVDNEDFVNIRKTQRADRINIDNLSKKIDELNIKINNQQRERSVTPVPINNLVYNQPNALFRTPIYKSEQKERPI